MTVPETILTQLGGKRFITMTGARKFTADGENKLIFTLPRNAAKRNISRVTVRLDWSDTYTISFYSFDYKNMKVCQVAEYEGIYFDQLQDIFTQETGLYTKL